MTFGVSDFLGSSAPERQAVFEDAAKRRGTNANYIEKDFWVCRTLDLLFNDLPEGHPELLFKGGTSLSKAYGLIDRFSEDIDLVVSRKSLGFEGATDPAATQVRGKQQRRLIEELKDKCKEYINDRLLPDLKEQIENFLSKEDFELVIDPDEADGSSLLFKYPTVFPPEQEYIERRVKIEAGARSALTPSSIRQLRPYIAESLSDEYRLTVGNVRTVAPERTFWDKAMILHGWCCGHRDEGRMPSDHDRLSRHYYDLAILSQNEIADSALADQELRENVQQHTLVFFRRAWMKLHEAVPGTFCLVPGDAFVDVLRKDYGLMTGMVMGDPPPFDAVIAQLRQLEQKINRD